MTASQSSCPPRKAVKEENTLSPVWPAGCKRGKDGSFKASVAQVPWTTASGLQGRRGQVEHLILELVILSGDVFSSLK